jgi:hypothetical protein
LPYLLEFRLLVRAVAAVTSRWVDADPQPHAVAVQHQHLAERLRAALTDLGYFGAADI